MEQRPELVRRLVHLGLPCLVCGETFWGTLAELCERHGKDVDAVVTVLGQDRDRRNGPPVSDV